MFARFFPLPPGFVKDPFDDFLMEHFLIVSEKDVFDDIGGSIAIDAVGFYPVWSALVCSTSKSEDSS